MMKKILCGLLAACLAAGALVSCGNDGGNTSSSGSSESESSASASGDSGETSTASSGYTPNFDEEPYTVHMQYMVAQEGKDQQQVFDTINEMALSELNMQVEFTPQSWGTWATNMPMMLAAGEAMDLYFNTATTFGTYIQSGYMANWADYLEFMPGVTATLGDTLNACYVGDFLAGIPMMKEQGSQLGLIARKDITDEVGFSESDFNITTQNYTSFEQLDALFAAVQEAHPEITPLMGTSMMANMSATYIDAMGNNYGVLENFGQTTTVTNWFESEQYMEFCKIARRWFEAGYISSDAATSQDNGAQLIKMGAAFSTIGSIKPNTDIEIKSQTGYDVYVIPLSETAFSSSNSINGMVYSLAGVSEDKEKAAVFYNWAFSSPEFNDLINWGIEGVDWVEDENGMAAFPEGVDNSNVGYHNDQGWAYPNQFIGHAWTGNQPDIWDQYEEFNSNLLRSKAFGFTFDSSPVVNEISTCDAVYQQYYRDLSFGTVDPEANIDALNNALYGAGLQTIMDEKQSQLNAWLAEQG